LQITQHLQAIQNVEKQLEILWKSSSFKKKINPENLIVTNGLGAAIDMLCHVLFDEGDAVILPTPNYSYLKIDITLRPKVDIIYTPMDLKNMCDITRLEEAWNKAKADGINVRGLFLTSPVNPTGTCLTKQQLEEAFDWCDKKGIHCIVDEVCELFCL
jgi:aspartate/methionine/tyrosine aminotransferase